MTATLELSKKTVKEALRRLEKARADLEMENRQYDKLYEKYRKKKISEHDLEACAKRVRHLEYVLSPGSTLRAALRGSYERYLWDYYSEKGLIALPYDINEEISSWLGEDARRMRREVANQLANARR